MSKNKNDKLNRENIDLLERVKQLDEDTDDGIKMLRNAQLRERKLGKEVEDSKIAEKKHAVKISTLVEENQELNNKFKFVKEKFENSLTETKRYLL